MGTGMTAEKAAACIANIGPRERRKRVRSGVALMVGIGVDRLLRLLLLLPFWAGAVGVLQARERT